MPVSHGRHRSSELEDIELDELRKDVMGRVTRATNHIAKKQLEKGNYIVVSPEVAEEINRLTRNICQ